MPITQRASPPASEPIVVDAGGLRALAREEDLSGTLAGSALYLADAGVFVAALGARDGGVDEGAGGSMARRSVDRFVEIAEVNLPAARLYEGHVNAVRLVARYADGIAAQRFAFAVRAGAVAGVWGADGNPAVPVTHDPATGLLAGTKRYASGLGIVSRALVTARDATGTRLALVDATDPARADPASWAMAGMRATASGTFECDGLTADLIGAADVYHREPLFLGGVWRIAAVTLGGVFGLLEAARSTLTLRGRLDHPAQIARLAPLVVRALAAREATVRVAAFVEGPEGEADPERAASLAIGTRLLAEDIGQDTVRAVERSVGLPHFEDGGETGRIARDLATYMRQAAGDALLERAGALMLAAPGRLADLAP